MALKPDDALAAARNIWAGPRIHEATRLNWLANAVNPRRAYPDAMNSPLTSFVPGRPTVEMPLDAPQVMKNLAWKARTNFLPLVVDSFSQVIKADGYLESNGQASSAWQYWQANGMDARQTGVVRSALTFGAAYMSILPGDKGPVLHGFSPRRMTAIYQDPDIDDWPMMALDVNGPMLRLFDEECVYRIGVEQYPISGLGATLMLTSQQQWHFIDASPHGFDFCPVARFRDRMLLMGEEQFGIVEPLVDIQRRIDETTFSLLSAQYYAAFKQRYITGWIPKSEVEALRANVAEFWAFADPDVKIGTIPETDLSRILDAKDSALGDMAAIAQLPSTAFGHASKGPSNVSAEAVASLDAGKDRKGGEIKTSLGETFELVLRAAAACDGDNAAAEDTSSQMRWRDMSTTSPGAIVDALGKLQSMLGIPAEMLWKRVPGWTDQDQAQAEEIIRSGDSLDRLMVTLSKQQQPSAGGSGGSAGQPSIGGQPQ